MSVHIEGCSPLVVCRHPRASSQRRDARVTSRRVRAGRRWRLAWVRPEPDVWLTWCPDCPSRLYQVGDYPYWSMVPWFGSGGAE